MSRGGLEHVWIWKHVDIPIFVYDGLRRRKTRFEGVAHSETADGCTGIDDEEDLGLRNDVMDYLCGVNVIRVGVAGSSSVCRRSMDTCENPRLWLQ